MSKLVSAEKIVEIAIPDKTRRVVEDVLPSWVPIAKTSIPVKIAPKNAPIVMLVIPTDDILPKTMTATAPQDAPEESPNT